MSCFRGRTADMSTYGKLCTEYYDLSKPEAPTEAVEFYLSLLESASEPVLEPMCGSGRFLIPFLERGIDIDGVDSSPHMLQACHDRCEAKGLRAKIYQQRLEDLDLPRRYGYIFIPAGSFGLVTGTEDAIEAIQRLHRHLVPGGKLVFEIETPWALPEALGKWHQSRVCRPDGTEIVYRALPAYDAGRRVQQDIHWYGVFSGGRLIESEVEELSLRLYEQDEFRRLLLAAGFSSIEATTPYKDCGPGEEDGAIVFQCRRPR